MRVDKLIKELQKLPKDAKICCSISDFSDYDIILSDEFGLFELREDDKNDLGLDADYIIGGQELWNLYDVKEIENEYVVGEFNDMLKGGD